jgi:hypothetical protein
MEPVHCIILTGNSQFPGGVKTAGSYRIATELRKNGYNVKIIDMTVFHGFDNDFKNILSTLITKDTLWVGFGYNFIKSIFGLALERTTPVGMNEEQADAELIEFIKFCKKCNPKIKIVASGYKRFIWKVYGVHYFIGYSDTEIIDYTNWCAGKTRANLSYHLGETRGKEFENFVTSNIRYTDSDIMLPDMAVPIELSRGCIFKCKFCAFPLNGKTKGEWIKRPEVLRSEMLENYERYGITNYIFADDTHNDSLDKLKLFYDEVYSKLPFKINFSAYMRLDLLMRFPEQALVLKESGLRSAVFGIETLSPASAKIIGKGVNPREQLAFLKELKEGLWKDQVLASSGWIIGLPADNPDTAPELEEFLWSKNNPLDHWSISPLYLKPKHLQFDEALNMTTEFEKNYEKYGYEFPKDEYLNSIHWVNKKLGLDFRMCAKQVLDITDKSMSHPRWHHGGFGISDITSCGVSYDDATKRTAQEIFYLTDKKKLDQLKYEKGVEYKKALMSHYNLYLEDSMLPDANLVGLRGKPGVFYKGKPFKK